MRDEFLQANLRAITHLPDMVKLSLVSRHIFCLFILTREVFSCHYPATFLRVQFFEEELKVHDSDMNLLALLPEIPLSNLWSEKNLFVLKWKHLGSKDYTSKNVQDFMGTVQCEYPQKECQKSLWTTR